GAGIERHPEWNRSDASQAAQTVSKAHINAFVNRIWPTLILRFGPPAKPTILATCSRCCFPWPRRSGALRRCFCGALGRSVGRGYGKHAVRSPTPESERPV